MPIKPKARYVEWFPGTGLRYALHFTFFPEGVFGRVDPIIMIVGPTYAVSRAMLISAEFVTSISLARVMRVMDLSETNAVPVTIMIAAVLGIEADIPENATSGFTPWRALPPFTFAEEPVL